MIKFREKILFFTIVSAITLLLFVTPVIAYDDDDFDYPITAYANPNNPYGWGNAPPYLTEVESTLTIEPVVTRTPSSTVSSPSVSGNVRVTISPFSVMVGDKQINQVIGFISGTRQGVTLTIAGKGKSDSEYSDITVVTPDENGLFAWAVPTSQTTLDLFRVSARSGGSEVVSNAIRFTNESEESASEPVISPVKPTSTIIRPSPPPIQTVVPVASGTSSGFGLSRLSISASTTTPAVGETVTVTGRLTDQNGKGISGATVTMDESGYSGEDPLTTTQTGSDGRFTFTVGVSYPYTVGMAAHYDGDESHSSADSNTIMFTAH
nr:hypothetical protein [uncultured Methanospirillum sp.]